MKNRHESKVVSGVFPAYIFGERFVMARQLHPHSKLEVRENVRFLKAGRLNCAEIHRESIGVYEKHVVGAGNLKMPALITDNYRLGKHTTFISDETIAVVQDVLRNNRCI